MSRLTASLVVDLVDKTGAKTQAIIGNMDRLKRAERDYMLASNGVRLSNRDRAMEKLMIEQEAADEARRQRLMLLGTRIGTGIAVGGAIAAKAYTNFAELERRVNRIVINADKGGEALAPTIRRLQDVADQTRTSFDEVTGGFEALVASGRSLDEALAFLPAVALTAQASGSAMDEVATTADAMSSSLKINADEMQRAFDILITGGKLGKFEMREMAQYLPSLAPAFAALGYKGTEGLSKLVAMLQTVRMQTGSSAEAATVLSNVFNKMESPETLNKFKKAGIDLQAELAKVRDAGGDVMDKFLDLANLATKGDLSKLGQFFTDVDYMKGVRALITLRQETERFNEAASKADNAAIKDFGRVAEDSAAKIQRLQNNWDKFMTTVGAGVATVANPAIESVLTAADKEKARAKYDESRSLSQQTDERETFFAAYMKKNPDAWIWDRYHAYEDAKIKVGTGEARTLFDSLSKSSTGRQNQPIPRGMPIPKPRPEKNAFGQYENPYRYGNGHEQMMAAQASAQPVPMDKAADGFMQFHGLVEASSTASDKIAEGGGKAADTLKASAGQIGQAIGAAAADSILSRLRGSLGALLNNPGGGRPTGQVVQEQANGQFVDP